MKTSHFKPHGYIMLFPQEIFLAWTVDKYGFWDYEVLDMRA